MKIENGTVYLAGAGPGHAGLITLRAQELLKGCACIVYDALVSPEIMRSANPAAEKIYVGKRGNVHAYEQHEINALLVQKARAGLSVLRLKGGDPYLFGRGAEEAIELVDAGIPVEVIPGVTAGIAAPALAGIPVTHREHASAVAFVTGHEDPTKPETALDWGALSKIGTLCFYMGVKNLGRIAGQLSKHISPQTPVAVIQWGSTPRQRSVTGTLENIEKIVRAAGIQAPALTVVGDVVSYREKLNFFERAPLLGKKILVTRARAQASALASELDSLGAQVFEFPAIRTITSNSAEFRDSIQRLVQGSYDWVVLTSVNGVDAVFEELARVKLDARAFKAKAAVVGQATADRLNHYGITADLMPPEFVAESLAESLKNADAVAGRRFLLPRADIARSFLPETIAKMGGVADDITAYTTVMETEGQEEALAAMESGGMDAVTFTSASTARNFAQILGPERLKKVIESPCRFISIGPQTSLAMTECAIPVHCEAERHDITGLVIAVRNKLNPV